MFSYRFGKMAAAVLLLCGVGFLGFLLGTGTSQPLQAEQQAQAIAPPLTNESLGMMLRDLGYTTKEEKSQTGSYFLVTVVRSNWTFNVVVELSPDKTNLWFSNNLFKLPDDIKDSGDRLLDLMDLNTRIAPVFGAFKSAKVLTIKDHYANLGISNAVLRKHLDEFVNTIEWAEPYWNASKWATGKPAAAPPAELPKSYSRSMPAAADSSAHINTPKK
jgi:hypothetical protein